MDTAALDLYFQKLDEFIYDEGKIITWKSIANSLKLPINQMPELFSNYLLDRRQLKPNDFGVTYCLCGVLKDNQKLYICCVDEETLHKKRELFQKIIKEQVYSIQISNNIDFDSISLVDQIETFQDCNLPGSIVSKNCIKRTIKKKPPPFVQTKPSTSLVVPKQQSEKKQEQSNPSTQNRTQGSLKGKNNGGIANFFTKAPVKTNSQKIDTNKPKLEDNGESKENNVKQSTTISNNSVEDTQTKDHIDIKEEKMEVEESNKKDDKEQNDKKRKRTRKNNDAPSKKRKRIQVINDSDSSDIFSEADEDVVEKSDDEPEPPQPKPQLVPKNKVRKAVDKTYEDEDGYIITKTEYVFESASEDEKETASVPVKDEPKPKILQKKNSTTDSDTDVKTTKGKKNKKPVSGKQPTLMNFFKKI